MEAGRLDQLRVDVAGHVVEIAWAERDWLSEGSTWWPDTKRSSGGDWKGPTLTWVAPLLDSPWPERGRIIWQVGIAQTACWKDRPGPIPGRSWFASPRLRVESLRCRRGPRSASHSQG
jgi:hypothetical protein